MLILTPAATAAVSALLHSDDAPEGAGLRLQGDTDAQGKPAIGIAIVSGPESEDEAVPGTESDVFLAPDVADLLDDQVLDAEIGERGVAFMIFPQGIDGDRSQ